MNERYCTRTEVKEKFLKDKFFTPPFFFLCSDSEVHIKDGGMIILEEDDDMFGGHKCFKTTVRQQDGRDSWDGFYTPLTVMEYVKTMEYQGENKIWTNMVYAKATYKHETSNDESTPAKDLIQYVMDNNPHLIREHFSKVQPILNLEFKIEDTGKTLLATAIEK